MKMLIAVISVMLCLKSCEKELHTDDVLTIEKSPFTGNQLRTDGYYYTRFDNIYSVYFFYSDGIVLSGGFVYEDELEEYEMGYKDGSFVASIRNNKLYWGGFAIDLERILIEKWYPSSGGGMPVFRQEGEIQNDTTFIITKSVRPKTGEEKELNEVYHFKAFSPKPDSTNSFVN